MSAPVNQLAALENAIAALEAQRSVLGDDVVDTAIGPLARERQSLFDRTGGEQRKLVTVLFSDLVDFTVLSQQLDPEDVRTVIGTYFARWQDHIEANGGVVEKYIGDAVMAVFGLYRSAEDDPHRAIAAALAMRASLGELNERVEPEYGVTLDTRVGIDTGQVVVSTLGDRPGQEFVVVGEVVNRASRLQSAAPPGGILVSADTYRHVSGSFAVQPLTGLELKGIAEPVDGYLVQTERPRGFRLDDARGVEGVDTKTIGRDAHLQLLKDRFFDVAEERQWRVVTVIGDAGVGKSRLLADFSRWLDDLTEPVWWFSGRAAHHGPLLPYALLRDLFATRFDIHDSDDPSEVRRKWELGVAQADETSADGAAAASPDSADRAHLIAHWLGFNVGESRVLSAVGQDPKIVSARAMAHLGDYFRQLSERAPVVLLLEDVHWADEAMLDLVDLAEAVLRDSRVLVVATARPTLLERHPRWGEGLGHHIRLPLDSLSHRQTRQLLAEILRRVDTIPSTLTDLVVNAAEGNPFYVEELVKWMLEAGVVVKVTEDSWQVREGRLEHVAVPPTLRSVLQARLDSLSPSERVVLQRASVVGRVFWDDAVESLRTDHEPGAGVTSASTAESLDRLRTREVVYERERSTFDDTREFSFKHALLRDVAYEGMLRGHRQRYHGTVARWLEKMVDRTGRADEYAGVIADHYARGGDPGSAAHWYLTAGRQAVAVNAPTDALNLLARGLEVVPASPALPRFDLLLARESVLDRIGDRLAQQGDLDTLASLVSEVDDPARRIRLMLTQCRWSFHHSEYDAQSRVAQEAVLLAHDAGLPELENEARLWWGKGLAWVGQHDAARDILERALAGGRQLEQRIVITESLRYLAIVASNVSEFPTAEALLDEALTVLREGDDTEGEAAALVQLGSVLYNAGRFAEARDRLESALPMVVGSGFRYREAVVASNLASIVTLMGELGLARTLITRGLELCRELDDTEGTATALNILGDIHRRVGDYEQAEIHLRTSLETAPPSGFEVVESDTLVSLALITSARGDTAGALALVDDAIARGQRAASALAVTRGLVAKGYVLVALDRATDAGETLSAARQEAERLNLAYLVIEAESLLARVALRVGDTAEAVRLAERVLGHLEGPDLIGTLSPAEIYQACRDVFVACGDPRADDASAAGRAFIDDMAARIDDDDLRESFLRVPAIADLFG